MCHVGAFVMQCIFFKLFFHKDNAPKPIGVVKASELPMEDKQGLKDADGAVVNADQPPTTLTGKRWYAIQIDQGGVNSESILFVLAQLVSNLITCLHAQPF